ncbi:hypothetical protein D7Y34_11415 [Stenotrophomonas maltophilia]|nr:hypothetical protein [Stenotrophomonas maltophilia]MBA0384296.1 hypothetical protein [Stenotrophomonas maltophilia]
MPTVGRHICQISNEFIRADQRSAPTRAESRSDRSQETVEGGVGQVVGVSAAWMPRPSPHGRVYGVPHNLTRPANPQETSF